jgi:hypothetical protein
MPITGASRTTPGRFLDNGGAWIHVEHPDTGYSVGMLDASPAIQAALDTGKHVRFTKDVTYTVGTRLALNHAGQVVHLNGSTLATAGALISVFSIGNTGADVFVKTDDITIRSGFITGLADGTGSPTAPPYAIGVLGPATVPYTEGIGCSGVTVHKVRASGFCFGVVATGADDVVVTKCRFGGMKYYAGLAAGGYSLLLQTCFNVRLTTNRFVATATDRHAIYISADPSRTKDNNNVCKDVVIKSNRIDWRGTAGATGFEAAIVLRAPEVCTVTGNLIRGGYGGIDYEGENGTGRGLSITGNVFDAQKAGASSRACISFVRSSGSYILNGATVTGNTFAPSGTNMYAVAVFGVKNLHLSGNTGAIAASIALVTIAGSVTGATLGPNTWDNNAQLTYVFAGSGNADILINRDQQTLSGGGARYSFTTTPTRLQFGFPRVASVNATSSGTPTIGADEHGIIASVANHASGLDVTFAANVDAPSQVKVRVLSTDGTVFHTYVSAVVGQVATLGAKNQAGTALPGASNSYTLAIEVTS